MTNISDTPIETAQSDTQASDIAGTFQTSTPPLTARLSTSSTAPNCYALVPSAFLIDVLKKLIIVKSKVKNIDEGCNLGSKGKYRVS